MERLTERERREAAEIFDGDQEVKPVNGRRLNVFKFRTAAATEEVKLIQTPHTANLLALKGMKTCRK